MTYRQVLRTVLLFCLSNTMLNWQPILHHKSSRIYMTYYFV
jgi:hypothetical protein